MRNIFIKHSILILCFLFHPVFANEKFLTEIDKEQIQLDLGKNKIIPIIVELSNTNYVTIESSSSIGVIKKQFLNSHSIQNSQVDGSINVVDELENFLTIILEINSKGLKTLLEHPQVKTIEANKKLEPHLKDAVPFIMDINNPWNHPDYDGAGTWVAVLDTGVNVSHPMFRGKRIIQACFVTDGSCPNGSNTQFGRGAADPMGKSDHGTHVAGIAVGNYIATESFGGVAHNANLIAIQIFNSSGSADFTSLLRALNYVVTLSSSRRVAAVNVSMGNETANPNGRTCDYRSSTISAAVRILRDKKIAVVSAAGNWSRGFHTRFGAVFPACLSETIAVTTSNRANYGSLISLTAPGYNILSASYGTGYATKTGTSMAAAMVSGAFAVLRSIKLTASVSAIETALQNASRFSRANYYGSPRPSIFDNFYFQPLIAKARNHVGGSTIAVTRMGFNTQTAIQRLRHANTSTWNTFTGPLFGANGVAYSSNVIYTDPEYLIYPQTILTGSVATRMQATFDAAHGLLIRQGGAIPTTGDNQFSLLHDGYSFLIKGNNYYIEKHKNGKNSYVLRPEDSNPQFINPNDWNIFLVTTGGKRVKFYLNGNLVADHSDERLVYGAPGIIYHRSTGQPVPEIFIDWFVTKSNAVNDRYR